MDEIWRTLVYQGKKYEKFEVSNRGNLRNALTKKVYKQCVAGIGYPQVCVSLGSRNAKKIIKVHKAVAEIFIPNAHNKPFVNHKDGDKTNSDVSNLEWVTAKENSQHAWETGLETPNINTRRKITDDQVKYIRNNYIEGDKEFGARAFGRMFGVSHSVIVSIIKGESYANID